MKGIMWDCGVPLEHCSGALTGNHQSGVTAPRRGYKIHSTQESAQQCAKRHVRRHNAAKKDGDPILLTSKPVKVKRMHGKDGRLMAPTVR